LCTANVFCAVEPKAGRHFTYSAPSRSAVEFSNVIVDPAIQYPAARTIHLVLDNRNIHRRKSLTDLLSVQVGGDVWGRRRPLLASSRQLAKSGGDRNWHPVEIMPLQKENPHPS
jgi:hypothetical protein